MKTVGINEIRSMVAEALPNAAAAQKLTDAIVRATELSEDETRPVSRDYLDARLVELRADLRKEMADLRADFQKGMAEIRTWTEGKLRTQLVQIGSLIFASVILNHWWK
jgi:hypothetical protein